MYLYSDLLKVHNSRDNLASTGRSDCLRLDACNHSRVLQNKPCTNFATKWQCPVTEHLKGCGELKAWNLTTVRAGNPPGAFNFHEVNISDTEEPELTKH